MYRALQQSTVTESDDQPRRYGQRLRDHHRSARGATAMAKPARFPIGRRARWTLSGAPASPASPVSPPSPRMRHSPPLPVSIVRLPLLEGDGMRMSAPAKSITRWRRWGNPSPFQAMWRLTPPCGGATIYDPALGRAAGGWKIRSAVGRHRCGNIALFCGLISQSITRSRVKGPGMGLFVFTKAK